MIVSGKIVKGLQEGRKLGYPTINLDYSLDFGLNSESGLNKKLAHGIYAGQVFLSGDRRVYKGAVVVGGDFVDSEKPKFEVFIIDFDESLASSEEMYGQEVKVKLLDKIRDMMQFLDIEELKTQIKDDIEKIKLCLQE